jgi:hypothetical protein
MLQRRKTKLREVEQGREKTRGERGGDKREEIRGESLLHHPSLFSLLRRQEVREGLWAGLWHTGAHIHTSTHARTHTRTYTHTHKCARV